ncbi:Tetratricopeptide repeat-containing protein [Duganella sp. CF458]|uniref:tetratricopeptide repeat protein n=1 Tax=Duganella sp. CF458 TaxID=1884368 RepID=UPI0008E87037|nr:tetratricopeptide repeat protein [Duganella sp. CF458]SFG35519.1 Tetratricopeptide repeat-containing protein [Duganella sp. CF458]
MLKSITAFLASLGAPRARAPGNFQPSQQLVVKAGDVLVQPQPDGQLWSALKVFAVDGATAHCLTYESCAIKPTLDSLAQAPVRMAHSPRAMATLAEGWELAGNQAATARELQGLKYMDFELYVRLTGQDADTIMRTATEHFERAGLHAAEGRRIEAINEYGKAIELYPAYTDALDKRAFAFMELGLYQQALRDLDESIYLNPEGMTAFFSKGECLLKLGHLDEAEAIFVEGQELFPEHAAQFNEFLKRTRAFALTGRPA